MSESTARVAVVTGGARGIGRAIGAWFLHRGWKVALLDNDRAKLAATVRDLAGDDLVGIDCDVSAPDQVARAATDIAARLGPVDALINNAGVAVFKPALDTSFAEWRHVMGTNLDGAFLCSTVFGASMAARGRGAIVNITSISGLRASTLRVAYGTSKAALTHMTKQFAVELGPLGVRVNAVAPGPVETAMAAAVHSASIRADYHDAIPLGRYGGENEIAEVVGFLCSDAASYVTGQLVAADGGFDAAGIGLPSYRAAL